MRISQGLADRTKRWARNVLPVPVHRWINRLRFRRGLAAFDGLETPAVFSKIYAGSGYWGNAEGRPFTSGEGTSSSEVTDPYVEAVAALLATFEDPPDVVDLGSGDFVVGARVRPYCGKYTACDVAPEVVEANRLRHAAADVEFLNIDIAKDALPRGDVAFIRQVLQHLSNAEIAAVVPKLSEYSHVVVTEHLPVRRHRPNIDMPTGPWTRLSLLSGVDIAAAPFHFDYASKSVLCEIRQANSVIRTTYYKTH